MAEARPWWERALAFSERRRVKDLVKRAARITELEPEFQKLTDAELAREDRRVPASASQDGGESLDSMLPEAFANCREASVRVDGHAPLRRAVRRRHRAARGLGRGDAHRRGQDARRHAAAVPQRADRAQRPPRHHQRLPRQARRRVDAAAVRGARHDGRVPAEPAAAGREARRLRLRHHVRHQQRVRLRLPARQHGVLARRGLPARPLLRDRRRGRLDPDRRGAHAADHLRPAGGGRRDVLPVREDRREDGRRRALRVRREAARRVSHRGRRRRSPRRCSASRTCTCPSTRS